MAQPVIQSSFSSGELSPQLFGRVDLTKYHQGVALAENFFVDYRGGLSTRIGTGFINAVADSTNKVRLIPFELSSTPPTKTYVLEFGNFYLRIIKNGGMVLEAASIAITAVTTGVLTSLILASNPYSVGDVIFLTGLQGLTQLNSSYYIVSTVSGNTIGISNLSGTSVDTSTFGPWTGGGVTNRVYKIASPYAASDLALIKISQVGSLITITHPSYPPYILTLLGDANWAFGQITFGVTVGPPPGVSGSISSAGSTFFFYCVTSVDANGQESAQSATFTIQGVNIATTAGTISLTWPAVVGAVSYNIYKIGPSQLNSVPVGALFGFIGSATSTGFFDTNISPNFSITPPITQNPFVSNNPGVSCYFQQRQTYAASNTSPQTFWMSQPGSATNFNVSNPPQASDAITGTLVSSQVNAIKSLLPMPGGLIALTAKGAWQISGGGAALPITPSDAQGTPQAYNGASDVPPIVINEDILYVQSKGAIVRDLSYNIYVNIYTGNDITVLSNHLFFGFSILEWAWAEEPFKVLWAVRSDGSLLSLTYVKAQEVLGWTWASTYGLFESIATITETVNGVNVDATYVVVRRFINGQWIRYIERFHERQFTYGAEDAWCVDSAITNAPNTPSVTLSPSAASGVAQFVAGGTVGWSVGDVIRVGGGIATITAINGLTATATITQAITNVLRNDPNKTPIQAPAGQWSYATPFTVVSGLSYLEGQIITGLADGSVIPPTKVVNGQITLPNPATKVILGLSYTATIWTLPIDTGEPTIQGKRKKLSGLTMRIDNTRGLKYGRNLSSLVPVKERSPSTVMGAAIPLQSTDEFVRLDPLWDVRGQIYIVQDQPLPATVLALMPELTVGDTK